MCSPSETVKKEKKKKASPLPTGFGWGGKEEAWCNGLSLLEWEKS